MASIDPRQHYALGQDNKWGAPASLAPGARGTVGFSFQVPKSDELGGILSPQLNISINAAGKRISETGVPENLQSSANQKISLASDIVLTAQGLYYANPFGSVTIMPAKAGMETTYAMVFTVTNTTNKISDKVTAHLPPYVRWVGFIVRLPKTSFQSKMTALSSGILVHSTWGRIEWNHATPSGYRNRLHAVYLPNRSRTATASEYFFDRHR